MVTESKRWFALALLCLTGFMIILDASIVLVAVPSIERELTFSTGGVQWVPSGYALMFGGLLLLGGRISDLLGRRRTFHVFSTLRQGLHARHNEWLRRELEAGQTVRAHRHEIGGDFSVLP